MPTPRLSLIIVAYNMARELPRTIRSLSPAMQNAVRAQDYEIIVVDNGSTRPFDEDACREWFPNLRVHHVARPTPSPVTAINEGLRMAAGKLIGVWIDGARLASPGLLDGALNAARLHERPVIGTIGFHLGPDLQRRSIKAGYNQQREDELLASVEWTTNGYRLFEISCFAGSSAGGWFMPIGESNALFLNRDLWRELGGYDERFRMPGGGLANLDVWRRACEMPHNQVVILLGEGTFHQIHGGAATNADEPMFPVFHEEYKQIRGEPFVVPEMPPVFVGRVPAETLSKLAWSAGHASEQLSGR
jgi:glycosyltransferase involved in cell wall biosynthesis